VDDISAELHISKKTIYQYFSTKEEIFYYVIKRIARQYARKMESDLASLLRRGELARLVQLIFVEAKPG